MQKAKWYGVESSEHCHYFHITTESETNWRPDTPDSEPDAQDNLYNTGMIKLKTPLDIYNGPARYIGGT